MMKALNKLNIKVMHFNIVKDTYDKHKDNIILIGEKLKAFPSR